MNRSRPIALMAFLLLAGIVPAQEQSRPATELPIRRIVLFSSGVAYVQREGEVEGNARVQLQFHAADINDLLKSLVVQDCGGGQLGTIQYDNRDPVERTLKSYTIDLTNNPSFADLLSQVRGERVELVNTAALGKDGQPQKIIGQIVSVQSQVKPVSNDQVKEVDQLNLLTEQGLLRLDLERVASLRFLRPELEQEFRKALEVLATGRDQQKKTVTLNFLGTGKRSVRVGYVIESPMWKTSYRLSVEKDGKAFLQGWGIVENTSDDDWKNVRLSLVSGRPISFEMDLYEPLYVPRPFVEPELFSSLRPRIHDGSMGIAGGGIAGRSAGFAGAAGGQANLGVGGGFAGLGGGGAADWGRLRARERQGRVPMPGVPEPDEPAPEQRKQPTSPQRLDFRQGVASAAVAGELGEFFHYEIDQPVTIPRQKSALLPIVNNPIEVTRVSVFNSGIHAKYPMHGLQLKNTTGLHLMQGPITVFDNGSYAGDAQLGNLQPKENRLVTYAVDLGTEVVAEHKADEKKLVTAQVVKGVLHATHRLQHTNTYTIKNRSAQTRTLVIEHPYQEKLLLVSPEKPAERTRDLYRFEVKAESDKTVHFNVVEYEPLVQETRLLDGTEDVLRLFLQASVTSAGVRKALTEVLQRRGQLAEAQRAIQVEEAALTLIAKDQERMRGNMERVPKESEAFKRYLKKFDEQETEIEQRRAKVAKLQETAEQQRQALEKFLAGLEVQ